MSQRVGSLCPEYVTMTSEESIQTVRPSCHSVSVSSGSGSRDIPKDSNSTWRMKKSVSDLGTRSQTRGYYDSTVCGQQHSATRDVLELRQATTVVPTSSSFVHRVGDALKSSFGCKQLSKSKSSSFTNPNTQQGDKTLDNVNINIPSSGLLNPGVWWSVNQHEVMARPWKTEESGNCHIVPDEHTEYWERTQKTVSEAIVSVLGQTAILAHDTLVAVTPALSLVPVPGLALAAKLLLNIWDTVQEVDTNRLAFMRLTERCGFIIITLHHELHDAGESVVKELSGSMKRIEALFKNVEELANKEGKVPFLKRYLRRKETLGHIGSLNQLLDQELQILGPSFQIRAVKVIKDFAAGMDDLVESACQRAMKNHNYAKSTSSNNSNSMVGNGPVPISSSFLQPCSTKSLKPLGEILDVQDCMDKQLDLHDLRQRIVTALQSGSDLTILEFLQIPRQDILEAIKSLQRHLEYDPPDMSTTESVQALHREFVETGIDALRRMSTRSSNSSLPNWTITRFEIDCRSKIGIGFYSDVYEGVWRGQQVAVKVLHDVSSSRMFLGEVEIWKNLSHPNVLELYGASSASGIPPWFFVSPYAEHGDLGNILRSINIAQEHGSLGRSTSYSSISSSITLEYEQGRGSLRSLKDDDLQRFMLEIAMGMDYLHAHGVLHGDLKCANVLVDQHYTCMLSDFGQSEIRAEAYRMSGITESHGGTLRWQPPEIIQGSNNLTPAVDIYAYAITCVEILSMGQMPWNFMDDATVQYLLLKEDRRPPLPSQYQNTPIHTLLEDCWHNDPQSRLPFSDVVIATRNIRRQANWGSANETTQTLLQLETPNIVCSVGLIDSGSSMSPSPSGSKPVDTLRSSSGPFSFHAHGSSRVKPRLVAQAQSPAVDSEAEEETWNTAKNESYSALIDEIPEVSNEFTRDGQVWEENNERYYRLLLNHEYHPSLALALWEPMPVSIGAVGYLLKPSGRFITLFNALTPSSSSDPMIANMPSIAGYGKVSIGVHKHATRNVILRGIDSLIGLLNQSIRKQEESPTSSNRRASFNLRSGHRTAYMYTESTEHRYMRKLDGAKSWFKANVNQIIDIYGSRHGIYKDELVLVIGTLQAPNYALFVSHDHPDGCLNFHALSDKRGKQWGTFNINPRTGLDHKGPYYEEFPSSQKTHDHAFKISVNGEQQKALLIARLRFKADNDEPTLL